MIEITPEQRVSGLLAARQRLADRKAAGLAAYQDPYERLAAKPSPMKAIAAKCWDCQGRDHDPGVKWRIGNCECWLEDPPEGFVNCALYHFRPYKHLFGTPMPKALAAALGQED